LNASQIRSSGRIVLAILASGFIAACGGGGDDSEPTAPALPDTTPPTVSSTAPTSSATGVALNATVTATFSEAMTPASLTTTTFTLRRGTTSVAGAVAYSGNTATFTPSAALTANTLYTATITTGVTDVAGNPMAQERTWSFTTGTTSSANRSPTIGGSPATSVLVGNQYTFTPTANDPDGDTLTFTMQGTLPSTIVFNGMTGRLQGVPVAADVGSYSNIRISVADGRGGTANLAAFNIAVVQTATGSATLMWTAPTQNADNTPLADLAGYRISYGNSAGGPYPNTVTVANAGVTSHVIGQLTPGTYYFVARAYDTSGNESSNSNETSKLVN
jgi:hypothetical protein